MGLYGPNASGKTSILDAMYALKTFVLFSSQEQKPTSKIPFFEPFALEKTAANSPSTIGVTFDLDGDRFFLEVSATPTRVHKELLTVQRLTKQPSRKSAKSTLPKVMASFLAKPPKEQNYALLRCMHAGSLVRTGMVNK
jgi:DNA repair exonuclease SbcCD ATPase subunit